MILKKKKMRISSINLWCLCLMLVAASDHVGAADYSLGGFWQYYCINNATLGSGAGSFTSGSTYDHNLEAVIREFGSYYSSASGFIKLSSGGHGKPAENVYAIGLCRGDASDSECSDCFNSAPRQLRNLCGTSKEAIGWQENCMVRYSNRFIFGSMETKPFYSLCNPESVPAEVDTSLFDRTRDKLLDKLRDKAARGNSTLKLAIGNYHMGSRKRRSSKISSLTLYGIVQCTPDLDRRQCDRCLGDAISAMPANCPFKNSRGGRVYFPSCYLRYENNSFTGTHYTPPTPAPPRSSSRSTVTTPSTVPPPPPPTSIFGSGKEGTATMHLSQNQT